MNIYISYRLNRVNVSLPIWELLEDVYPSRSQVNEHGWQLVGSKSTDMYRVG